jgi:8-oxo-(d)GTP phosphatase
MSAAPGAARQSVRAGRCAAVAAHGGRSSASRMPRGIRLVLALAVSILAVMAPRPAAAQGEAELWRALASPGHFAVIRHALAPGTGDPPGFTLGKCTTQRNLSEAGREQARTLGARLRAHGIESARVYSSRWCRCLETARWLGLGPVEELPLLDSFFARPELGEGRNRALVGWLGEQPLEEPTILVTHQVNITALIGDFPASGEIFVVRRSRHGELSVVGSIRPDS